MEKKKFFMAVLLVMTACVGTSIISSCSSDEDNQLAELNKISFNVSGTTDGHEYVDLGLPSGTLWAMCNVGANSPEQYGDYFAWGETSSKSEYNWTTCFDTEDNGATFNKYNNIDITTGLQPKDEAAPKLLPEDDAATANWGSNWQMPSYAQIVELCDNNNTTTIWTTHNGVNGRLIKSKKNENCIFLPAPGYRYYTGLYIAGNIAYYWSRSLDVSNSVNAYYLSFGSGTVGCGCDVRCYGRSVRPVRSQE